MADEDAGPTKAWIVTNRKDPAVRAIFDSVYGKRPREELYDLNQDRDQMNNLAKKFKICRDSQKTKRLINYLRETNDPTG